MKYNIAIIGTFDYENFGDLMFPIVFKKQLEKRIELNNLFLFSPNQCQMPLNPEKTQVYSIDKLEQIHNEYGLHAIVFGGGDLARLDNAFAPQENYFPENTSFDLMIYSAILANKYNIPYLWNCPGVPFEFAEDKAQIVKCLLDNFTDYASVRESRSAQILSACGCQSKIIVSPDTVLSVSTFLDKNAAGVFDKLKSEYTFLNDGYIVFQSMINNIEDFDKIVCEQLSKICDLTKNKIVFLPIGNVHNDDVYIGEMLANYPSEQFVTFDRKLNVYEINSVLANAIGFIGTSLHGNVVSNSYKVPSVGLNLYDLVKLKNYFTLVGREEYCIKDVSKICDTFMNMLSKDSVSKIDDAITLVENHFDNIVKLVKDNTHKEADVKQLIDLCYQCNSESEVNNVTVYYDFGDGYDENSAVRYTLNSISNEVNLTLDVPPNAKSVRIDPADDVFCIVKNLRILCCDKELAVSGNYYGENAIRDMLFFFNTDPQIIIDGINENSQLHITFEIIAFFAGFGMTTAWPKLEPIFCDVEKALSEKCDIIKQKDFAIDEQNKKIDQKNMIIKSKEAMIADINAQYLNLNKQYNEVINSFYWRITALPRKVTHRIKVFLGKNYALMDVLVFIKGFLRGGVPNARKKLIDYRMFTNRIAVDPLDISSEQRKLEEKQKFQKNIKFSILVPLYNTPKNFLCEMIESVQKQTYQNWELCLADGSDDEHNYVEKYCHSLMSKDKRIKYKKLDENKGISDNTNECFAMASGDYYALFDHDDLLHPSVLFEYAEVIEKKNADFIYCDEVTFTAEGDKRNLGLRHHKPEFSPDTLRSYNYICHFTCFAKELYDMVGGFNKEFDGSQDYDLILRLTEKAKSIVRIPKMLYFWRSHQQSVASGSQAKPYVVGSAKRALAAHLERIGLSGSITESIVPTTYRVSYDIIGEPKVSIIIPNKDHIEDLDLCISSIYAKSTYKNFEIIVVENNSTEDSTFKYYEKIRKQHQNIKVVFWKEKVFNYSAINNFGAQYADGEYILLLNNDIEILTSNWIEEMLMFAQREEVGAVGAKLYYPDDTIQHAGVIIGLGGVAGHSHKYYRRDDPGYMARASIAQNLSACTAACLLIRKDVFEKIDGLDEGFAVAFNDIDLCMKIRKAGYLVVFTPYAEFYHYESKSRGFEDSPEKIARFNGEIARFTKKWAKELEKGDPYYNPNLTLEREDFTFK